MLNDILAEDNQTFNQENYKFNPPEKQAMENKKGAWNEMAMRGPGMIEQGYGRRDPAYNKENSFGAFPAGQYDEEGYTNGKRVHYGSQFINKTSFQNKKKEMTLYAHPDVHFCEKKNKEYISKEAKLRRDAVHIFGVDFFSESDLLDFFKEFRPQRVEWINDSSCNVIFMDGESASNAVFSKTTQIEDKDHELDWRRGLDIEKEGKSFNFLIRFATDQDTKDPGTKGVFSKYYKFVKQQSFNKKKGVNKKVQKGKAQKQEMATKKGTTMTLMDRKKTFGKRVIRNNIEILNKLPDYDQMNECYPPSFGEMHGYGKMGMGYHH